MSKDANFIKADLDKECAGCGKCCYLPDGTPCKYLSTTQRCQIYQVRLNAPCGKNFSCIMVKDRGGCEGEKGYKDSCPVKHYEA